MNKLGSPLDYLMTYGEVRFANRSGSRGECQSEITVIRHHGGKVTMSTEVGIPGISPAETLINAMLTKFATEESEANP